MSPARSGIKATEWKRGGKCTDASSEWPELQINLTRPSSHPETRSHDPDVSRDWLHMALGTISHVGDKCFSVLGRMFLWNDILLIVNVVIVSIEWCLKLFGLLNIMLNKKLHEKCMMWMYISHAIHPPNEKKNFLGRIFLWNYFIIIYCSWCIAQRYCHMIVTSAVIGSIWPYLQNGAGNHYPYWWQKFCAKKAEYSFEMFLKLYIAHKFELLFTFRPIEWCLKLLGLL